MRSGSLISNIVFELCSCGGLVNEQSCAQKQKRFRKIAVDFSVDTNVYQ